MYAKQALRDVHSHMRAWGTRIEQTDDGVHALGLRLKCKRI